MGRSEGGREEGVEGERRKLRERIKNVGERE